MDFHTVSGGLISLYSSIKTLPIFTHPPYLVIFLVVLIIPSFILIDLYTGRAPEKRKSVASETKKTR